MENIKQKCNFSRYSWDDLRVEVNSINGMQQINFKYDIHLNSVLVIYLKTGQSAIYCGEEPQIVLLEKALNKLYTLVENAFKIEEDKLTNKIEDKTPEEWNKLIEEWHTGKGGVGLTLREYLGMNKETYETFCTQ